MKEKKISERKRPESYRVKPLPAVKRVLYPPLRPSIAPSGRAGVLQVHDLACQRILQWLWIGMDLHPDQFALINGQEFNVVSSS